MATEEDRTNSGALATLVAVLALAMVGVSLAVTALTRDELENARAQKEQPAGQRFMELKRSQLDKLAAGKPIEQAMQEVVAGLKRDPESATPPSSGKAAAAAGSAAPAPAPGENAPTGNAAAMPESPAPGASGAAPAGSAAPAPHGSAAPTPAAGGSAKAPANDTANGGKEKAKSPAVPSGAAAPKPVAPPAGPGKPQSAPAPASAP